MWKHRGGRDCLCPGKSRERWFLNWFLKHLQDFYRWQWKRSSLTERITKIGGKVHVQGTRVAGGYLPALPPQPPHTRETLLLGRYHLLKLGRSEISSNWDIRIWPMLRSYDKPEWSYMSRTAWVQIPHLPLTICVSLFITSPFCASVSLSLM